MNGGCRAWISGLIPSICLIAMATGCQSDPSAADGELMALLQRMAMVVAGAVVLGGLMAAAFARWANRKVERLTADLQASKDFLQSVMDSMPFPVMVLNRGYEIIHVNHAMDELAGGDVPCGQGARCHEELASEVAPCEVCPHGQVVASRMPVTFEKTHGVDGEKTRSLEMSAAPVLGEDGEVEYVIETIRDITDRKQVEEEQMHAAKLEGVLEMAGGACHELGQPLQALMNMAGVLKRKTDEDDPRYPVIVSTGQEVARMGDLIGKIMRITRYEPVEYLRGTTIVDIDKSSNP